MSRQTESAEEFAFADDSAPGDEASTADIARGLRGYLVGLFLAVLLTALSFWAAGTHLIYGPAIPIAIAALAFAQMGVHLVFFLHITTAPDNTNNAMALAFGVLICVIIVFGSAWIMFHLNHNLMPMNQLLQVQR
ncbi:MAG TPA: cytochrome o ubiquinol oxidase subunit IV [Micropepsaceae bacterium]|nr:cytochrome o ubiquinol oxidase subunit IV [Micropepsaceae bacterium]